MSTTPDPNGPSFVKARQEELPPWLAGPQGKGQQAALGAQEDLSLAMLISGVEQRWPTSCTDDALDFVGTGFAVERYAADTNVTYRARLLEAWKIWEEAGSRQVLLDLLHAAGINDVRLYEDFEGTFDPGPFYTRTWVVLGPDMPWDVMRLAAFSCGDSTITLGSNASPQQVREVKALILKWKWAYSYPVKVILHFADQPLLKLGTGFATTLTMPFTLGGYRVSWRIGKIMGDTLSGMPFVMGGFYDDTGSRFDRSG